MGDLERFPRPTQPWIWEAVPGYLDTQGYRWVRVNEIMHDPATGVTIRYRRRDAERDVICGARSTHPGLANSPKYSAPFPVVCSIIGDHGEQPHVGVPADCADMTCDCSSRGSFHLVIVGVTIASPVNA